VKCKNKTIPPHTSQGRPHWVKCVQFVAVGQSVCVEVRSFPQGAGFFVQASDTFGCDPLLTLRAGF